MLFETYLHGLSTKRQGRKLGNLTIEGILYSAKHIEETRLGLSIKQLQKKYKKYLKQKNHTVAKYALWHYLKYLGYDEKFLKDLITFQKRHSALTDQEKLAKSVLSKKELIYLVNNISKKRDKLIIKLLYDTGARVSELCNITRKDIELNTGEIQLMGKGRKPRTVFFQESTRDLLQAYLKQEDITQPNTKLITIKPVTIWYNLKKQGKELLDRDLRPHMFRHTRLQHMADKGVDSFLIKSYAGHSDISTTQIYVKSSKHQGKMAFTRAGDIWEKKEKKNKKLNEFFG